MSEIRTGWSMVPLAVLSHKIGSGSTPTGGKTAYKEAGVPLIRSMNIHFSGFTDKGLAYLDEKQAMKLDSVTVLAGDVLLNITGASIGRVTVAPANMRGARVNQHVAIIRLANGVENTFVSRYLSSPQMQKIIAQENYGATRQALTKSMIGQFRIPVPPRGEQKRIVAKLDDLTANSRRARENLDHIPRLVEKYKQAVLAAAFRGDLTREWRLTHRSTETPAERLQSLCSERARISANTLKRDILPRGVGGRIPVKLDLLPESWAVTTLERVTSPKRLIQYGILKPGPHVEGGVPYVKVMNIKAGRVDLKKIRCTTSEIAHQYRRAGIVTGDILLTIRGTVGRLAIVPEQLDGGNITQDTVRIAVLDYLDRDFLFWYLHSPSVQEYFSVNQKGVAVRGINVGDVRPIEVPFPPRDEQRLVVNRLNVAFTWINRLASEVKSARTLVAYLDQAILAKAFRGELVSQDPNDEPVSILLEQIRADRVLENSKKIRDRKTVHDYNDPRIAS